jgi:hypothetical protein
LGLGLQYLIDLAGSCTSHEHIPNLLSDPISPSQHSCNRKPDYSSYPDGHPPTTGVGDFIRLSAVICLNPLGGVTPLPLSPKSWFSQSDYYSNLATQWYRRQQAGGEFCSGNIADFQVTYNPPLSCENLCWKSSH